MGSANDWPTGCGTDNSVGGGGKHGAGCGFDRGVEETFVIRISSNSTETELNLLFFAALTVIDGARVNNAAPILGYS